MLYFALVDLHCSASRFTLRDARGVPAELTTVAAGGIHTACICAGAIVSS